MQIQVKELLNSGVATNYLRHSSSLKLHVIFRDVIWGGRGSICPPLDFEK